MLGSKGRKKKGKLDYISAVKELNDGEMQNELKLYGKDPGPIMETQDCAWKETCQTLGWTNPTNKVIHQFILFIYYF